MMAVDNLQGNDWKSTKCKGNVSKDVKKERKLYTRVSEKSTISRGQQYCYRVPGKSEEQLKGSGGWRSVRKGKDRRDRHQSGTQEPVQQSLVGTLPFLLSETHQWIFEHGQIYILKV